MHRRTRHCGGAAVALAAMLAWLSGCAGGGGGTAVLVSRAQSGPPAMTMADVSTLPDRLDIPLARSNGYLLVPGYIDGVSVGLMMIDTGASLGVIEQGVAGRLHLEKVGQGRTVGVGGIESFDYVRVEHLSIGRAAVAVGGQAEHGTLALDTQQMAGLSLLRFGQSLGVGLAGIVGFTDFGQVPFALDASAKQLTVYRPDAFRPPRDAERMRLTLFRRLPVIEAQVFDGSKKVPVRLLIDYGADTALTLPRSILEQHPGVASVDASGAGVTRGVGGSVVSTQTWARRVRIFGMDLEHIPVNFETPPASLGGPRPIGRVGNSLLQHFRLTFDPARGWVYAQWNGGDGEASE